MAGKLRTRVKLSSDPTGNFTTGYADYTTELVNAGNQFNQEVYAQGGATPTLQVPDSYTMITVFNTDPTYGLLLTYGDTGIYGAGPGAVPSTVICAVPANDFVRFPVSATNPNAGVYNSGCSYSVTAASFQISSDPASTGQTIVILTGP